MCYEIAKWEHSSKHLLVLTLQKCIIRIVIEKKPQIKM